MCQTLTIFPRKRGPSKVKFCHSNFSLALKVIPLTDNKDSEVGIFRLIERCRWAPANRNTTCCVYHIQC